MVEDQTVNTLIGRVNDLTKRLRVLEEEFASNQERMEDLIQSFMKRNSAVEKKLNEQSASFSSLIRDVVAVKKELKAIKKEMVKFAPNEKLEELEGFINLLSPMEAVTRDEVRKIVSEMKRSGTA